MDKDFKFWCIESDLDAMLYNIFIPLDLQEDIQIIDLNENPSLSYANEVSFRWKCLNEGLSSLQILQKMLDTTEYPIKISSDVVNRHEWFRITYDLILYRFASLRDYSLQLTNAVFELNLDPLKIKLKNIKKQIKSFDPHIIEHLDKISESGTILRNDRNLLAHEGIFFGIDDSGLEIRKAVSMFEADDRANSRNISYHNTNNNETSSDDFFGDVKAYYISKIELLKKDFMTEAQIINDLLNSLCNLLLAVEFEIRFNSK